MQPIFITGIGTGIGKTIVSAIVAEALGADYWKPVQAGYENGTDTLIVKEFLSKSNVHPELYKLELAASPHIAARAEGIQIDLNKIYEQFIKLNISGRRLVIEGAGGIMVPLNEKEFVADLIKKLNAKVILVSRNYLGSINHSLLTAELCRTHGLDVAGWIFNDQYLDYEDEIASWSGFSKIGSIQFTDQPDRKFIQEQAESIRSSLQKII